MTEDAPAAKTARVLEGRVVGAPSAATPTLPPIAITADMAAQARAQAARFAAMTEALALDVERQYEFLRDHPYEALLGADLDALDADLEQARMRISQMLRRVRSKSRTAGRPTTVK